MLIEWSLAILTQGIVNSESFLSGLFCIISSIEIWFISIKVDIDHKTYTPQLLKIHKKQHDSQEINDLIQTEADLIHVPFMPT